MCKIVEEIVAQERNEERVKVFLDLFSSGDISKEKAAQKLDISVERFLELAKQEDAHEDTAIDEQVDVRENPALGGDALKFIDTLLTPEEIAAEKKRIQDWNEAYKRKEEERKDLGMSKERYSYYVAKKQKGAAKAEVRRRKGRTSQSGTGPLSQKGSMGILEKIEDTIARFVDKYGGGKKYKRKL